MDSPVMQPSISLGATKELAQPDFDDPIKMDIRSLDTMLRYCLANNVDDLFLLVGAPWAVMWSEQVRLVGQRELYREELEQLLVSMTGNDNAALELRRASDVDFTYSMRLERGRSVRFRCNATACLGPQGQPGLELVMRPTGKIPPRLSDMGLPSVIANATMPKSGIVLICGPTGSGKTTLLDSILHEQAIHPDGRHILTFYAPIETDLNAIPGRTGLIAQSEIGRPGFGAHLVTFEAAVRNSLRRHPNVIVFGEARDRETIEGAILASQTGHTTYTTTHTSSVHMAIPRMADSFSGSDRVRITNALIDNGRLIVHQRLLKTPSGVGRAPVRSALVLTQDIRSELLRTSIDHLPAAMYRATNELGVGLLDDAIRQFNAGKIHEDELASLEAELKAEAF